MFIQGQHLYKGNTVTILRYVPALKHPYCMIDENAQGVGYLVNRIVNRVNYTYIDRSVGQLVEESWSLGLVHHPSALNCKADIFL